jgi:hypothetical protein
MQWVRILAHLAVLAVQAFQGEAASQAAEAVVEAEAGGSLMKNGLLNL